MKRLRKTSAHGKCRFPGQIRLVLGHDLEISVIRKNQEFLVRDRWLRFLKRCPKCPVMVPLEKGENEQKIRKLAQKFHIEEQIRFPGQKEDIGSYYQGMDVLYCPPDLKDFLL